ncbi:MAG: DUF655 domain-containing protein [Candidatus Poseidonia sp.]|nr:DUF655 domain-containing protein [Poseidonia sp.]
MTEPRRRRQIKTPSGPKKKATADPSSYKMSRPSTGRQEVPKPKPKPDPSQVKRQQRGGQGGKGRSQGGKGRSQGGNSRGQQRGGRGGRNDRQQRPERPEALKGEDWARVVEHNPKENVVTAMAENGMLFCRLKVKASDEMFIPNQRIYIGTDTSQRKEVVAILGMAHLDKMSNMARQDMPLVVQLFVEEHAQYFVEEFYNRAGPMNLKQHSFQLLPDIGNRKAKNMVEARNQLGVFASMDELNAQCSINGAELLARRFVQEIEDKALVPRLIDLLLPVTA